MSAVPASSAELRVLSGAREIAARGKAIGLPLIALKSELPGWLESGAEKAVGVVILLLAGRVIWKWVRGDYRLGRHRHGVESDVDPGAHRHLHQGQSGLAQVHGLSPWW